MQVIEKWSLLARLQFAPRCIFSNSPCIFEKAGNFAPRGAVAICVGIDFSVISSVTRLTASGGEVNDLIGRLFGEALPAVHLAHRNSP